MQSFTCKHSTVKTGSQVKTRLVHIQHNINRRQQYAQLLRAKPNAELVAVDIKEAEWDAEVLKADVPVLVDFWAPWCGPCRIIMPLMDQLQSEYAEKIKVVKVNTDDDPGIATEYGIRSIPTIMIFKGGQKMETIIGAVPKSSIQGAINRFLD